jgi:triosephosphate isomerase (TIM)
MAATLRTRRPLVAGNWKMNGLRASLAEFARIVHGSKQIADSADILVCPPATLVAEFATAAVGSAVHIGAQDCHVQPGGAFTGDLSAEMLKDSGASAVILGHSERRNYHRETDGDVQGKALAAKRAGLLAIVCVGETGAERERGHADAVVAEQLDGSLPERAAAEALVVAYEPVWAIGTGLTPSTGEIAEMHRLVRRRLQLRYGAAGEGVRVIYGDSVKAANAEEILSITDVDGALIGGASLKADEFLAIARVYC